jgi:micrococcal nuclease
MTRLAVVLVLIGPSLVLPRPAVAQRGAIPDRGQTYAVRYVVDGDTIDVAGIGRVRLLGIDAPELGQVFDTAAPFAAEARDYLRSLLVARWVRLEQDGDVRDRYGRTLAYVVRDDSLFTNAEMLRAGFARVSARTPLKRLTELRNAESAAQQARRGIWGDRPSLPPRSFVVPRRPAKR